MNPHTSNRVVVSVLLTVLSAAFAAASPVYFPIYDPFTNATASGGTTYASGATLAGQTNAIGSYWYGIDTTGTAANSAFLTNILISYPGVPPGPGGNALALRNVSGPGARIFVATNASGFISGTTANPIACYYSMVLQVSNLASLSTTGVYAVGLGDQSAIANQTSQPGTVAARLYFQQASSSSYNLGISKMGNTIKYSGPFTTNQTLFIVVDYEGAAATGQGSSDIVRLWVNPATSTFGNATQPTETVNDNTGSDLTPYISCLQFYNLSTSNANQLLITDFRMGTNWAWVTGGPYIAQQPPTIANIGGGGLNLSVGALNNGSSNGYQWQFNGTNLTDGPSVSGSGATVSGSLTASLTITNTTLLDAGVYDVIVTNAVGSVISSNAVASAYTFPVINVEPSPTNVYFYAGGTNDLSLSIGILGLPTIINYVYSNNTLVAFATNLSFTLDNLQTNASFYAVASNAYGMATSSVVTVTVLPEPTAPYPLAVVNDHPMGFWPLNEVPDDHNGDQGAIAHDYIAGNNGTYSNMDLGQSGYGEGLAAEFGYAPATDTNSSALFGTFADPDSYVGAIPNINFASPNNAPSFSVEAWVNANGTPQPSGAGIVNKGYGGGGEQFNMDCFGGGGSPEWRFYVRAAGTTITTAETTQTIDTNWHHLVGVLDAVHSSITIYYDGKAANSVAFTPSGGILSSASGVNIGSRMSSATSDFNNNFIGNIQNVAIYNYALTAAQVANHFNAAGIGAGVSLPSSVTVEEGTTLTIPSTNSGTPPLSYQWYDSTSGSPGAQLVGQTNRTLVISNISAAAYNGHSLDLAVSNIYGQATSAQVSINVLSGSPNTLAISPASLSLYAGVPAVFTVTGQGSQPFSYQWSTNGVNVANATNAIYTNTTLLGGPVTIGCAVSNSYGPGSPDPVTASLTGVAPPTDYYSAHVLKDGPSAYWPLNESVGASTANDYVGGHDATYMNATNNLPGFNQVLYPLDTAAGFGMNGFTSTSGSIAEENNNTNNGISLIDFSTEGGNGEFSVEMWIQAAQQAAGDYISKGYPNNTQFALDNGGANGAIRFVVHNAADSIYAVSDAITPDGNWHHLVGVCDEANSAVNLYTDGALTGAVTIPMGSGLLSIANNTYPVIIAAQASQGGSSFTGVTNTAICQVALYSYAMSSNQVASHYALGVAGLVKLAIQRSGNTALISWPATNGYVLQQVPALSSTNWTPVTNTVTVTSGSSQVQVSATNTAQFYRLAPQ